MQSNVKVWLFCLVFSLIAFAICKTVNGEEIRPQKVDCDVHAGPCRATLKGTEVTLDIKPKPVKAMQNLTFILTFSGEDPVANPYIDLNMPAMDMGRNRLILKPVGNGFFQGEGVIVRCRSGRRTWKATVTVPNMGAVEFVFDVIY